MRFHVVGLPFASSPACAYEGKVKRFRTMMVERGHEVTIYGPEHYGGVVCGGEGPREFTPGAPQWERLNTATTEALRDAEPTDFLCLIAGICQQPIADALPHLTAVEFGVGYGGTFTNFRVFESYAWMHTVYGSQGGSDPHAIDGRFYDAVIPNYFDVSEFPEGNGDGGYYLFMGRLIERKGIAIAAEACKRSGVRLVVAGAEGVPPNGCEYVGLVGPERRAELMGGAIATYVPTQYLEPFGGVAVESMLTGTPVITSDFGAFSETVIDGITGYRCHTLAEFAQAALDAPKLDRGVIRHEAIRRWSFDAVAPMYERYFKRLLDLWGEGWYA